MHERCGEPVEPRRPPRSLTDRHSTGLQTRPRSGAHHLNEGTAALMQHRGDLRQCPLLLGYPMQGVEGHHRVEVFGKRQPAGIAHHEPGTRRARSPARMRGGDHPRRGVDADGKSVRHHSRYRTGEIAVTAADVEYTVVVSESKRGQGLRRHRPLQVADFDVIPAAPVGHPTQLTRNGIQRRLPLRIMWHPMSTRVIAVARDGTAGGFGLHRRVGY